MRTSPSLTKILIIGFGLTLAACDPRASGPDPALARLPVQQLLQTLETSHDLDRKRIALVGYLNPDEVNVVNFTVARSTVIVPLFSEPEGRGRKLASVAAKVRLTGGKNNWGFELQDDRGRTFSGADAVRVVGTVHYFDTKPKTPPPSPDQLSMEQKQNPAIPEALDKLWSEYEQQKATGGLLNFSYVLQDVKISLLSGS